VEGGAAQLRVKALANARTAQRFGVSSGVCGGNEAALEIDGDLAGPGHDERPNNLSERPMSRGIEAANAPTKDQNAVRGASSATYQFVGFRLGGEDYAIAITKIQEIIVMKPITRIPQVPGFIEGLINLRGSVIPVVNLRTLFGLPHRELDDETRTIIVNVGDRTIGYIVDEVTQVMRIAGDQIQPAPVSITAVSKQHIAGLAQLEDRLLVILEIERLLKPEELEVAAG
jgi:purine-binding chemotaxis protein CheW